MMGCGWCWKVVVTICETRRTRQQNLYKVSLRCLNDARLRGEQRGRHVFKAEVAFVFSLLWPPLYEWAVGSSYHCTQLSHHILQPRGTWCTLSNRITQIEHMVFSPSDLLRRNSWNDFLLWHIVRLAVFSTPQQHRLLQASLLQVHRLAGWLVCNGSHPSHWTMN